MNKNFTIFADYKLKIIPHMKRFTFMFFALFIGLFVFAQSANSTLDVGPKGPKMNGSKGAWTLQVNHTFNRGGSAGCETDGINYYVTQWSSDLIWKVNMSGVIVDSFSITGVTGLRDLAYDGEYFYGGKSTNVIYKMKFDTVAPYLVSTISSPNESVRNICYDPTADNGAGGFWVGNWATDFSLVSRSGTVLSTIASTAHGLSSTYGTAYDTISTGGPYIWTISAGTPSNATIIQIKVSTGAQTGLTHDVSNEFPGATTGGGLWMQADIVTGTTTLGGLVQGTAIFGYDLATTLLDTFDLEMTSLDIPFLVPIGGNTDIKGIITNNGSATISNYDINYQIDNGSVVTQNVSGASITTGQSVNFTHSTPYTTVVGLHIIDVWVSNPNGNPDVVPSNDTLNTEFVGYDAAAAVQRMPLYETFTSSTCSPCVAGNANMQALFAANANKWNCVKYQMSWPGSGDPYFTTEGYARRVFYQVTSVPHQFIDGGYDGNSSAVTQSDFDAAYAVPALMEITANIAVSGSHEAKVNYTIVPKMDIPANAILYVAIVEKNTFQNTGNNGETEFNWVMKKMLPDGSGAIVGPLTANSTLNDSVSYQFNGSYRLPNDANDPINNAIEHSVEDFSNLVAVVWVQYPNNKYIFQSALSSVTVGMTSAERENLIRNIYPNPATNQINVDLNIESTENVEISIVNNLGQVVSTKNYGSLSGTQNISLDVSTLQSGIYFVNVVMGTKKYSKPIQVK